MPYSSFFSLPLPRGQYERAVVPSKRKNFAGDNSETEPEDGEPEGNNISPSKDVSTKRSLSPASSSQDYNVLPRDTGSQYRLAGLGPDDDVLA